MSASGQAYRLTDGLWQSPGRSSIDPTFILGVTRPTASISGIAGLGLTTADLTVITGDVTINDAYVAANGVLGALVGIPLIQQKWIKGHVIFTATQRAALWGCQVEGRTFTGAAPWDALIHARSTTTPTSARIDSYYCTIRPIQPDVDISCAAGERLGSFYRCDLSLGSDLIDYWSTSCPPDVKGCYLHDFTFWANDSKHTTDPVHPGWSHNDAVQYPGGVWEASGGIIGNNIEMYADPNYGDFATLAAWAAGGQYGCGVILTVTNAAHVNAVIQKNWFRGGERGIQMTGSANLGNSWDVSWNRFCPDTHGYGAGPTYSHHMVQWLQTLGPAVTSVHDNVYDDLPMIPSALRGQPVPAARSTAGEWLVDYQSTNQVGI